MLINAVLLLFYLLQSKLLPPSPGTWQSRYGNPLPNGNPLHLLIQLWLLPLFPPPHVKCSAIFILLLPPTCPLIQLRIQSRTWLPFISLSPFYSGREAVAEQWLCSSHVPPHCCPCFPPLLTCFLSPLSLPLTQGRRALLEQWWQRSRDRVVAGQKRKREKGDKGSWKWTMK